VHPSGHERETPQAAGPCVTYPARR